VSGSSFQRASMIWLSAPEILDILHPSFGVTLQA
jgi:hypothetical protein